MALTAADVIDRAENLIHDETNVRWTAEELLRWLNDARKIVCIARPDIYALKTTMLTVAGVYQSIHADGETLLDVYGVQNGRAIRLIEREWLDATRPDWRTETATAAIKHYMFDERTPKQFMVYPPATSGTVLEYAYAQRPSEIAIGSISTELTQEGLYADVLIDLILYRAYGKDAEFAGNEQRSNNAYARAMTTLGLGGKVNLMASPNTATEGAKRPRIGGAA